MCHTHKTSYDFMFQVLLLKELYPSSSSIQTDGVAFKSSSDLKSTCVLYIVRLQFHSVVQNCINIKLVKK